LLSANEEMEEAKHEKLLQANIFDRSQFVLNVRPETHC
jgi:hypothetical protein